MNKQQRASERITNELALFGVENITKLGNGVFAHNSSSKSVKDLAKENTIRKALQLVKLHISNGLGVGVSVESAAKAFGLSKSIIYKHRAKNVSSRLQQYLLSKNHIERTSGLLLWETGTRNISMTENELKLKKYQTKKMN